MDKTQERSENEQKLEVAVRAYVKTVFDGDVVTLDFAEVHIMATVDGEPYTMDVTLIQ